MPESSPAPAPPPFGIRAMFVLRDAKRRWPHALRAAVCMGVPALVGWALGDVSAGLMANIGAFTALYGSGRPYLSRAWLLALVALSLAVAVSLGVWAAAIPALGVAVVVVLAMAATWICNALQVGPPGAYMFSLSCAAGTAMGAAHLNPISTGLLILAGGVFAWLVHMSAALFRPRGPEKAAVAAAGEAVIAYLKALGTPRQDTARHWAAQGMHTAWTALVNFQPARSNPDSTLARLRGINRALHLTYAAALTDAGRREDGVESGLARARELMAQVEAPPASAAGISEDMIPLGRPGPVESLRQALSPGSATLLAVVRVGIAALVSGYLGLALGLDHAYWAIAAAVLMLHQGFDWLRTVQRSIERTLGTWVGLLVTAGILVLNPQGWEIAVTVMVLQFVIEMVVVRNYALAVIFITPVALIVAHGAGAGPSPGELLWARGSDTALGCVVALLVFRLVAPRAVVAGVPGAVVRALEAVADTAEHLADARVTTPEARVSRRRLQDAALGLAQAYDAGVGGSTAHRHQVEPWWPVVAAVQRLAYRTLASCWTVEAAADPESAQAVAGIGFGVDGLGRLERTLAEFIDVLRTGGVPGPVEEMPPFLAPEVDGVYQALRSESSRS